MKRAAIALILINLLASNAHADCSWYDLPCAAREAGREAAKEFSDGMVQSTDIVYSAINFWPWLIQKYHTGTEAEQKEARELVKKVFGVDSIEAAKPFEITFQFEGIDTSENELDFILLRDYAKPDLRQKIARGNTADFNSVSIIGVSPPHQDEYEEYLADVKSVESRVAQAVSDVIGSGMVGYSGVNVNYSNRALPRWACTNFVSGGEDTYMAPAGLGSASQFTCGQHPDWQKANKAYLRLVSAIMLTIDPKIDKRANRPTASFAYEGYQYLTIVIPEAQLRAQPNLKIHFSIHVKDNIQKPIPLFEGNVWDIEQKSIAQQDRIFSSTRKEHDGRYYAYTIDLGV